MYVRVYVGVCVCECVCGCVCVDYWPPNSLPFLHVTVSVPVVCECECKCRVWALIIGHLIHCHSIMLLLSVRLSLQQTTPELQGQCDWPGTLPSLLNPTLRPWTTEDTKVFPLPPQME